MNTNNMNKNTNMAQTLKSDLFIKKLPQAALRALQVVQVSIFQFKILAV